MFHYKQHLRRFIAAIHNDHSREGGDVEQEHEKMAREAAESACLESLANIEQVREGGLIFLQHQGELWDGMLRELEKARHVGQLVAPRPIESVVTQRDEKRQGDAIGESPNTTIKQATSTKSKNSGASMASTQV